MQELKERLEAVGLEVRKEQDFLSIPHTTIDDVVDILQEVQTQTAQKIMIGQMLDNVILYME